MSETTISGIQMNKDEKGVWKYDTTKPFTPLKQIKIKAPQYRDQPELKALSDLEFAFKKQFRNVARITVLEIVKYLTSVDNEKQA